MSVYKSVSVAETAKRVLDDAEGRGLTRLLRLALRSPETGALSATIALSLALSLLNPNFLTLNNLGFVARGFSFTAIAAMGACMVIITGGIDLSVGSVMGLAGVVAAFLSQQGLGTVASLLGGVLVGAIVGLFNGTIIAKAKIAPFIVTLGTLSIARGLVYVVTGGWPMQGFTKEMLFLGQGFVLGIPVPVWIMLILTIIMSWVLSRTTFGWYVYSLGGNEEASRLSGVPTDRVKIFVYFLAGILGAIGGVLLTTRLGVGETTAGLGYELDIIAAAVIGGVSLKGGEGSALGVVFGAALMGILRNGLVMLGVTSFWQQIVIGAVIILAVLVDRVRARQAENA